MHLSIATLLYLMRWLFLSSVAEPEPRHFVSSESYARVPDHYTVQFLASASAHP